MLRYREFSRVVMRRRDIGIVPQMKATGRWLLAVVVMAVSVLAVWTAADRGLAQNSATVKPSLDKVFPSANKCKRCHERAFEEWEASPLSRSIHSPAFRSSLDEYLAFSRNKDKALCFRCHAPHVNEFVEQAPMFVAQVQSGAPAIAGVCSVHSHVIKEVDRAIHPPAP